MHSLGIFDQFVIILKQIVNFFNFFIEIINLLLLWADDFFQLRVQSRDILKRCQVTER